MSRTVGILPLARATFDVAFAEEMFAGMRDSLERTGHHIVGPRQLLFDADATRAAIAELKSLAITDLFILQITFTDAAMTVEAAQAFDVPLAIWAVPEPRLGGRLRLNALCGLNLAAFALGLREREFSWLYASPDGEGLQHEFIRLFSGERVARPAPLRASAQFASPAGTTVAQGLKGTRIGRIGEHPPGFDTCRYDETKLSALAGVSVAEIDLDALFAQARQVPDATASATRAKVDGMLADLDAVDQDELDRSLRLKTAMEEISAAGHYDAFAIRCWPETFTAYGGAACGPVSMLGEKCLPCACEADVYGALTTLMLQRVADAPAFMVDLVDVNVEDGTSVVWHCGQAPVSMANPKAHPRATIHTNRRMPLLFEFALKPGRVTFARISQARGRAKLVIAAGEMQDAQMAFAGTSGVVRFDTAPTHFLEALIGSGIEHHMTLAYGDHRQTLRGVAAALDMDLLEL